MNGNPRVKASAFYEEYHGHQVRHLEVLLPVLRDSCDSLIWTAGDSSLDNKYWFSDHRPAVGAYREVLDPPSCNADVTYWLNYLSANDPTGGSPRYAAINTAVEATTVNQRTFRLRSQDVFLRDNMSSEDILIVSIGGNDVAMAPAPCTILSMLSLVSFPTSCLEKSCAPCTVPFDDRCCGCGSSMLSCACACPPCFGYMVHLFGTRVQRYIEKLTAKTKPKKILICMIYYPDENVVPSWAGPALGALGYNKDPSRLQAMIRKAFVTATASIQIPGCEVIPVPLFHVLDGKNSNDYIARVEPSSQGGKKMAEYFLDIIQNPSPDGALLRTYVQPPSEASYIAERG